MARVFIGLGTNIGDRVLNLSRAVDAISSLPSAVIINKSAVEETEPVEFVEQPVFLNQVVLIETANAPLKMLGELLKIETSMGRVRNTPKGPRIIDLDILLYDDIVMHTDELIIPHPGIKKRNFVMKQLLEIDSNLADPATGREYREIYSWKN
jgi:2-amino-4-hydroxy-6-hydroxymethyldihydropteridine diphosphokinase